MKKFIFIPVVNNFDLLEKAVKSVKQNICDEYIIFNNSEQEIPEYVYSETQFKVFTPQSRKSFMDTQNIMRQYAIDNLFDYYLFMHNDGEVLDDTDVRLANYAENLDENWGVIFTHYDVLCAFKTEAVNTIGMWGDENWPAQSSGYYLDCDYYRRLEQAGYSKKDLLNSNVSHAASNTIRDTKENEIWNDQRVMVSMHYADKWGGTPGFETR